MKSTCASNIPRYFVYTALKGFGFGLFVALWLVYGGFCISPQKGALGFFRRRHDRALG
jgi:hypothetical protein